MNASRKLCKIRFLPSATKLQRLCFYRRLSVHRGEGVSSSVHGGIHPPGADTPLGADTPTSPPPKRQPLLQMVRILLECILVWQHWFRKFPISQILFNISAWNFEWYSQTQYLFNFYPCNASKVNTTMWNNQLKCSSHWNFHHICYGKVRHLFFSISTHQSMHFF